MIGLGAGVHQEKKMGKTTHTRTHTSTHKHAPLARTPTSAGSVISLPNKHAVPLRINRKILCTRLFQYGVHKRK